MSTSKENDEKITTEEVKVDIELSTNEDNNNNNNINNAENTKENNINVTSSSSTNAEEDDDDDGESELITFKREDTVDSGYASGYANTVELMPNVDNYLYNAEGTVQVRPGYATVIAGQPTVVLESRLKAVEEVKQSRAKLAEQKRFGTFDGVVARCLLNIWGVIMFLRMGFVAAHAGVLHGTFIIFLSFLLSILSATSLSAIATNGEVEGGGAYFLISRSLGAAYGGSIGLIFSLANAISISMYLVGFAETVVGIYGTSPENFMTTKQGDIRIIGSIALVVLLGIACLGASWVVKFDLFQLVILVIGILAFIIGTFTTPSTPGWAFTGYSSTTFATNWLPDYRKTVQQPDGESFMSVFSIFFPAMTGMMAGANISGELKDAQKSIPFGTMLAIFVSSLVYMAILWFLGATCERDGGEGGLYDDSMLMIRIAVWSPLVVIGIFASTLSSALAGLIGAPRILKAVCEDKLFQPLQYFAKGREKDNEPVRGYFLAVGVAFVGVIIGDLNAIAPLITNFFLATRTFINLACFMASYSKSPGWRPTYHYYNANLSLFTAFLCVLVMFAISWIQALITLGIGAILYYYVKTKAPEVNWGAAEQGLQWQVARQSMLRLERMHLARHAKTWRPLYLLAPLELKHKNSMLKWAKQLKLGNGLSILADVLVGSFNELGDVFRDRRLLPPTNRILIALTKVKKKKQRPNSPNGNSNATEDEKQKQALTNIAELINDDIKREDSSLSGGKPPPAIIDRRLSIIDQLDDEDKFIVGLDILVETIVTPRMSNGIHQLLQTAGVGSMRPNMLIMPLKVGKDFEETDDENPILTAEEYVDMINDALTLRYGVGLLHIKNNDNNFGNKKTSWEDDFVNEDGNNKTVNGCCGGSGGNTNNNENNTKRKPVIDVYWLADTGGALLLVAHLHAIWAKWHGMCDLRVFLHSSRQMMVQTTAQVMRMIQKFRIPVASVEPFDMYSKPTQKSYNRFPDIFDKNKKKEQQANFKSKLKRFLRVGEVMAKESKDSTFIYMTLPFPAVPDKLTAKEYLTWLEAVALTDRGENPPPICFLRGNQKNVLTFYS